MDRPPPHRRGFGNTFGYRTDSSPASSGWATYWAKAASLSGVSLFQTSFFDVGTITSLSDGLPSRDTCT